MTPLDRDCPVPITQPAAIFWQLIKRPPVRAKWRAHLAFTVHETARALPAPELLPPLPEPGRIA